jgi:hypothetical protein
VEENKTSSSRGREIVGNRTKGCQFEGHYGYQRSREFFFLLE